MLYVGCIRRNANVVDRINKTTKVQKKERSSNDVIREGMMREEWGERKTAYVSRETYAV